MAQSNSSASDRTSNRVERRPTCTWLLPSNRKLRNVISISLRNISVTSISPPRHKGKTIDDDALPQTLRSPAKLVALREQKALGHSRSSTDLRAVIEGTEPEKAGTTAATSEEAVESANGSPVAHQQRDRPKSSSGTSSSPRRPSIRKIRRRSTLDWANDTPQRRQERLENTTTERMADVFFSLHVKGVEEPVYVSETVNQTMDPSFRQIDWSLCGPGVTRLDQLTIRVWANRANADAYRQLLQLRVELSELQYLGRSLDNLQRALPHNAVLFHLTDGVYMAPTGDLIEYAPSRSVHERQKSFPPRSLPTASFDALLRLAKLDDSIQDALATRDQLIDDLEGLLQKNQESLVERDELAEAEDRLKTIDYAKKTVEKQLDKLTRQQSEKRAMLSTRRKLMGLDTNTQTSGRNSLQQGQKEFSGMRNEHEVKSRAIQNQRRRVCEDLQNCYAITQHPKQMLSFSIRDLHLPNSENLDSEPPEIVAAALGHVAHTMQLLSFYLDRHLPYPVTPRGSTSSIFDPISVLKTNTTITSEKAEQTLRTYPLFSKGMPRFRFEYAVFLLNQNIRVLLENAFNLRALDIRQTLANLKYLLYVATAGEGELPARKAGGIRGLTRDASMKRVASTDSASSGLSGLTLFSNGKPRGAAERLREISGKIS